MSLLLKLPLLLLLKFLLVMLANELNFVLLCTCLNSLCLNSNVPVSHNLVAVAASVIVLSFVVVAAVALSC